MKKFILLVFLVVLLVPVFGHSQGFWGLIFGNEMRWDTTFVNTDSLRLSGHTLTTLDSGEVVYTDVMDPKDDDELGIYWIDVDFDSTSGVGGADSLQLYVRFYLDNDIHPNRPFTVWHQIGTYLRSDSLYNFDLADSTWNRPSMGKQYKATMADKLASVGLPGLGQYTN